MTITCGGCTATWTALGTAHCGACHRSFSTVGLFDAHRSQYGERGRCLDPATLTVRRGPHAGQPIMVLRDGIWSRPEMTEAEKLARFGTRENTDA